MTISKDKNCSMFWVAKSNKMIHSTESSQYGGSGSCIQGLKLKRARRAFQGGPVSNERFLQMQEEVYRLRREAREKEGIHKLWDFCTSDCCSDSKCSPHYFVNFIHIWFVLMWCRLIARLSRAENVAKRKMRDHLQQTLKPCKQKATIIATHVSHEFYADQVSNLPFILYG